jgi:NTP pyrophosphatase (non-canonical NTP hydrolase)
MYGWKDDRRGPEGTFLWFCEEVGELAAALRENDQKALEAEFADVLAWLATLANVKGVDLSRAIERKYGSGCPGCGSYVCTCGGSVKP